MQRRAFLSTGATLAFTSVALPGCGGGGGGGAPAPGRPPGSAPLPSPAVAGPAWSTLGGDAQHGAVSAIATQDFGRIAWSTPIDLAPQYTASGALQAHYGSPLVTGQNTALVAVKTGASSGFRIEARAGGNGVLLWAAETDYRLPPHEWLPSCNLALSPDGRLHAPGAGGKLLVRANPDDASGAFSWLVFYGLATYAADNATYDASVYINTPVTFGADGAAYFGFVVTGPTAAGLASGIARVDAGGAGRWVAAAQASGDTQVAKPAMNCAPALSPDGATLYIAVNSVASAGAAPYGYLLALDSATLAVRSRVLLLDPRTGQPARIDDNGTASPAVAPDGRVFFGVLESPFPSHNARGWLLQFTPQLAVAGAPGSFGWDVTPSIIPATMVPGSGSASPYLVAVKYNNYDGIGTGDGVNRLAVLDPAATQADFVSGIAVMREVRTIAGVTPDGPGGVAVREWCINTMAADPFTQSIVANSEDGVLYRWHLPSNTFTQRIQLTGGRGEAYTPTAVGADGAVYAVSDARLFVVGR